MKTRPLFVTAVVLFVAGADAFADEPPKAPPQTSAPRPPSTDATRSAPASASSDARALAETLFFTGRGMMEAGRYAEACQRFAESLRLDHAAGTLLNLAVCHEKEGKIASAWGEFKEALSDARKLGRSDREQLASEHIALLEPDLPYLTISVPGPARSEGLEVVRNGQPLLAGSWGTALPVDPGEVQLLIRAPGYKPHNQHFTIDRKDRKDVIVEPLEKAPEPVVVGVGDAGWSRRRKIGVAVAAAGAIGIGVGAYFGVRALHAKSTSDAACPVFDGERRCSESGSASMRSATTEAWVADIGIAAGATAALVGAWLFMTGASEKKATTAVTPVIHVGAAGGECLLRGRF